MENFIEQPIMSYETDSGRIIKGEREKVLNYLRSIDKCRCCKCRKQKDRNDFSNSMFNKKHPYCKECYEL